MHPWINREIKCAFRWYRSASLRHRNRVSTNDRNPPSGGIASLPFPARTILPFQILVEPGTTGVASWLIKDLDGATAYDMAAHIPLLALAQFANPSRAIICLEQVIHDTALPEGQYEMEITTEEGEVAYSETFELLCAMDGALLANSDLSSGVTNWFHPEPFNNVNGVVQANGDLPTEGMEVFDAYIVTGDGLVYTWNGSSWDTSTPSNGSYWGVATPGTAYYIFSGGAWVLLNPAPFFPGNPSSCWIGTSTVIPFGYRVPASALPGLVRIRFQIWRGSPIVGTIAVFAGGVSLGTFSEADNGVMQEFTVYLTPGATIEFFPSSGFAGCLDRQEFLAIPDGTDCMTMVEWWDCGDLGTVAYSIGNGGFSNVLYLREGGSSLQASVYDPTPQISEEAETDQSGASSAIKRRKEVEWRMELGYMPWHVMDALSEMVVSGERMVRVPWGGNSDRLLTARMETQWNAKDRLATGSVMFRVDEATAATGCCDLFDRPCTEPCGPADGIQGIDELIDGDTYLMQDGTIGHYCGFECEEPIDDDGYDVRSPCPYGIASLADGRLMRWTGTEWELAVSLVSVEETDEDCVAYEIIAVIPPGYMGRIEWSEDGSAWTQAGAAFTASEAEDGVVIDRPPSAQYLRVVAMGFECDLWESLPLPAPCACPFINFNINIEELCGSLPQALTANAFTFASNGGPALAMAVLGEAVGMDYRINGGAWVEGVVQSGAPSNFFSITDIPYTTPGDTVEIRLRFLDRPWCDAVVSEEYSCPV